MRNEKCESANAPEMANAVNYLVVIGSSKGLKISASKEP